MSGPGSSNSSAPPQFATAEYAAPGGKEACQACKQTISGSYYRVNGALACQNCVSQLQAQMPQDSHSAFVRGITFGVGGAILGLILYSGFGIVTGIEIGYLSLAVGFIVGKAIRMGSRGIGGRRYQIAAVILTYFAVSMSAVPIGISQAIKDAKQRPHPLSSSSGSGSSGAANSSPEATAVAKDESNGPSAGKLIGTLLFFGIASPFLELENPVNGALGIIILLVGVRIAWKMTAAPKIDILGPFQASQPAT
jgi:hypothetical protein